MKYRVPREEIWICMREKGTPKYVRIVKRMYERATTKIRSSMGVTDLILVRVGLKVYIKGHQFIT